MPTSNRTPLPLVWAVIPARGGSKGVPGKNLQLVGGRSLLHRAIDAARGSGYVASTIVTTDEPQIASQALARGAVVVDRPSELASDTASSETALLHALDAECGRVGYLPDILVFIQCTSPFVSSQDIDGVVACLLEKGADCALAVCRFHGFLWKSPDDASGVNHDSLVRKRRQELQPEYLETGAVYAMRVAGFREARHRFFGRVVLHELPRDRALEVDTLDDLALARHLAALSDGTAT
jgi:CMP-N-acetylneuraminic acid synthetase